NTPPPMHTSPTKAIEPTKATNTTAIDKTLLSREAKHHFNKSDIQCVKRVNPFSNPWIIRPKTPLFAVTSILPKRENSQGTIVKETKRERPVATIIVIQN